jgi:hypothetical protein
MLTNYNCYVLITVILCIFTLGSSLCISAFGLLLSSPSMYIPANDAAKVNSSSTRNSNITEDRFGITKLYPIKLNGEEWYLNMSNPTSDPAFNLNNQYKHSGKSSVSKFNFTKNPDGSWKVISPMVRMEWHENGFDSTDAKINVTSPLKGKWIGFKFLMYNLPPTKNESTSVKLENWINENADGKTWKKVDEKIDDGGWGKDGGRCGVYYTLF